MAEFITLRGHLGMIGPRFRSNAANAGFVMKLKRWRRDGERPIGGGKGLFGDKTWELNLSYSPDPEALQAAR